MATENQFPLYGIDLNATPSHNYNEDIQHVFPIEVHPVLQDLNVDLEGSQALDLNALPYSSQSQPNQLLFDLNKRPCDIDMDQESSVTIGNEVFNGKIGVFPFVTQEPAKRTSFNRVAGTLETKAMTSVKRDVIRSFLIEKVLPAIKEKWPREDIKNPIFIQQDNARTHISRDDDEFLNAATQDGFDIRLMCQPANSPNLNVLDLGFFSAIQSLQHKESPKNIDELISAVVSSFDNFSSVKSNCIFVTLQSCMIEIMKAKGSNNYKIPHLKKQRLQREQGLLSQLKCDPELVQEVLNYLNIDSS